MKNTSSKRIEWIDIAKGIAIILVVYSHCGLHSVPYFGPWVDTVFMPFFFMLSGMLFSHGKYGGFKSFTHKKWMTLIRPFIFFSLTVFVGYYYIGGEQYENLIRNFLSNGWPNALWFIPVLIVVEYIYLIISGLSMKMGGVILCISMILGAYTYYFDVPNYWNLNFVFTALFFYGIGSMGFSWIHKYLTKSTVNKLLFTAFVLALVSSLSIFNSTPQFFVNKLGRVWITVPVALSGIFLMICVAYFISKIQTRAIKPIKFALKYFGRNTYIVLAFHQIIIMLLPALGLHLNGSLARIAMWLIIILITELITRYLPWILGRKAKVPAAVHV